MTRHNLAFHISWLLSSDVTLPAGVSAIPAASASPEIPCADIVEEDTELQILTASPIPRASRRIEQTVNVVQAFQRPQLPSKITPKPLLQEPLNPFADESMGKLSSASRSTRPGLMSQHQLATPASTKGSTSSLMQEYSALLRANGQSRILYQQLTGLT
jgi:bloom syndrome protein